MKLVVVNNGYNIPCLVFVDSDLSFYCISYTNARVMEWLAEDVDYTGRYL